jgi:hypothetical protein
MLTGIALNVLTHIISTQIMFALKLEMDVLHGIKVTVSAQLAMKDTQLKVDNALYPE